MTPTKKIFPRSPREIMDGWAHLPRFIDKIRLAQHGLLNEEYLPNLAHKGFDALWISHAGCHVEEFMQIVKGSHTDGEICDWIRTHIKKTSEEKQRFLDALLLKGTAHDSQEARELLIKRKREANISHREDIQCFVDFIDADEGRI